jgi:hypothetical protein
LGTSATLIRPVPDASAWLTADFSDDEFYTRCFTRAELSEIDSALACLLKARVSLAEVRANHFPLPRLGSVLQDVQREIENGRGFIVLRGMPVDRYDVEDLKLLHLGLLAHLGTPVTQDTQATLVESVMDRGVSYAGIQVRGYMTNAELTPHCDSGDVVGLLCVRAAKSGGISQIASSISIYNEILRTRPEYLEVLYRGFQHNIRGNGPRGQWENVTRHRVPVFSYYKGRLSARYNLKAMLTAEQLPGVEPLSEFEREAIEYIGELAMRSDIRLDIDLKPGDIQLLNNHTVLHTRTAFEDYPQPEANRFLLRVWINMPNGRPLEDAFADHFNTGPRQPPAIKLLPPM